MAIEMDKHINITSTHASINARGYSCPDPMMMVRRAVRRMKRDGISPSLNISVLTDDPRTPKDLITFIHHSDYSFVKQHDHTDSDGNKYTVTEFTLGKA